MAKKKHPTIPAEQPLLPDVSLRQDRAEEARKPGRPRKTPEEWDKKLTIHLPKDVHRALKVKSAELDMPMTVMIIEAIKKVYDI